MQSQWQFGYMHMGPLTGVDHNRKDELLLLCDYIIIGSLVMRYESLINCYHGHLKYMYLKVRVVI